MHDEKTILDAWNFRKLEAQSSVFWNSLSGLSENDINFAKEISYYSQDKEFEAGRLVSHRNNEYLIKESWLKNTIEKIGFKIVVSNHVNSVLDKIILLQK